MPLRSSNADLFILKAHKLRISSFWKWADQTPIRANVLGLEAGDWLAYEGLNEEQLDAFCLTLRFLLQDRDGISIRKISEEVSTWPAEYAGVKAEVLAARDRLNEQLDKHVIMSIFIGRPTTYRDLFDIIFYGGLAHVDQQKRGEFEELTTSGKLTQIIFQAFWTALHNYMTCIGIIAHHMARAIIDSGENQTK